MWKLEKIWIDLRSSLWFLPTVFVLASCCLAVGLLEIDFFLDRDLTNKWPKVFEITPEGARGILVAIATSTVTVTGVVFSIVIVALSLASSQYTPRILRNFMSDRGTQTVLGAFVAIFAYDLILIMTIRSGSEPFVPLLALTVAVGFAFLTIGLLVYFIHHIAASIQVSTVVAAISEETIEVLEIMLPNHFEDSVPLSRNDESTEWFPVVSPKAGYLQNIAAELPMLASRYNLVVRMERKIGEFVCKGSLLLSLSAQNRLQSKQISSLQRCVAIDNYRTVEQDPTYGVRQLVDIALKALSPGINDTSTAINCIDYLGEILHFAVQRGSSKKFMLYDQKPRVLLPLLCVEKLIDEAFLQIRQSGEKNPAILLRLLRVIGILAPIAKPEYRSALAHHVHLIRELALKSIPSDHDRAAVEERGKIILASLHTN